MAWAGGKRVKQKAVVESREGKRSVINTIQCPPEVKGGGGSAHEDELAGHEGVMRQEDRNQKSKIERES